MADRIVILSANPGRVRTVVRSSLARPRDYRSPDFLALVDQLHEIITGHELPDPPARATARITTSFEALPEATSSEIVGLLEYLDARGGSEDLFRIAADTRREFGRIINIVEAAELLEFVDTPKRLIVLDSIGREFLKNNAEGRKAIWRQQLLKLQLYQHVNEALRREPTHRLGRDFVIETIVLHMPGEHYERLFETFIRWARFGNLFVYDDDSETLSLPRE